MTTANGIRRAVKAWFGVSLEQLSSVNRRGDLNKARQILVYVGRTYGRLPVPSIARAFVMKSCLTPFLTFLIQNVKCERWHRYKLFPFVKPDGISFGI